MLIWRGLRGAFDFAQTGCLAAQAAEVEQLRPADLVGTDLLDLVDDLGVVGENALDALAEAHLANGEAALGALLAGDNHALKSLETLFFAFFDLYLHADGVARSEGREVGALELVGQLLHDWMDRHCVIPCLKSQDLVYIKTADLQSYGAIFRAMPRCSGHRWEGFAALVRSGQRPIGF